MIRWGVILLLLVGVGGCGTRLPLAPERLPVIENEVHGDLFQRLDAECKEVAHVRALYSGSVTFEGRKISGRYILVVTHPFRARVEFLPRTIGPALLIGVFDENGGIVEDGTSGERVKLRTPHIPFVRGGYEYDLRTVAPLLFGRVECDAISGLNIRQGAHGLVLEDLVHGYLLLLREDGRVERVYMLDSSRERVQSEFFLSEYSSLSGVLVPRKIQITEYESEMSAQFHLSSAELGGIVPDRLFSLSE